jgi:hypothetical protein
MQKATLEALTTFCGKHPDVVVGTTTKVIPVPERHIGPNVKLISQLRASLIVVLNLSPQFVYLKPCMTPTNGWWEKVYSIENRSIGTALKKWRIQLKR